MTLRICPIVHSAVIPAHNEAHNLPALVAEVDAVLAGMGEPYEIVVVNDGSTDDTSEVLRRLAGSYPALRPVDLDGNYGQSAAFDAGFRCARGAILITLDADGQNPPAEIPRVVSALDRADMACGWRQGRRDSFVKRWASKLANTVRRLVLNDGIRDTGCSLKAFRREVVERMKLFHGMHRFLPALAQMEGFAVAEVPVAHHPRLRGKSHYGVWNRLWGPLVDMCVVYWMKRRCRRWRIVEQEASLEIPAPRAAPSAGTPAVARRAG